MDIYELRKEDGKLIKEGSMVELMQEIMKAARENSIPVVTYNPEKRATCFEFEGKYCSFRLYLN